MLVVDPDETNLGIMKFILTKEFFNYTLLTANSLLSTMNTLRNKKISLMLLDDAVTSAFDGLEILRRVRSEIEFQNTPIIMMTSKIVKENIATVFTLGISDYIIKPCEPEELAARVGKVLSMNLLQQLDDEKTVTQIATNDGTIYKILLIDDKANDLQREEESLKKNLPCEIVTARGGIEGLYILKGDAKIDLVLISMILVKKNLR